MNMQGKPVAAVIGAGPVGLAAVAHLLERGFEPLVFEAGAEVAASFASFAHVQLFSPCRYNVDPLARRMLEAIGWKMPREDELPTAGAMRKQYLEPFSQLPAVARTLRFSHRVTSISRDGFDKVKTAGREEAPFVIRASTPEGEREFRAWAVIDATGTWTKANPLGANGLPAIGELEASPQIAYGMPDILGTQRLRYARKRILVAGAGHSAAGNLLALAKLSQQIPGTTIVWTIRGHNFARIFGGGVNDALQARGALGTRLKQLVDGGQLEVHADFRTSHIRRTGATLEVEGLGANGTSRRIRHVDEIIVAAGGRPDLAIFSELRVKLDPWLESTEQLAPLIDPNVHSCGTVRPHGHRELAHPEARFYAVGAKSYGRAPNFLLATGHEQVRSVVAALAGDMAAADDVRLELPETGVCSTQFDEASSACCTTSDAQPVAIVAKRPAPAKAAAKSACCGGPPAKREDACCALDERVKDAGGSSCKTSNACGGTAAEKVEAISPG